MVSLFVVMLVWCNAVEIYPMHSAGPVVRDAISVNGLQVGEKYTLQEVVRALEGQPTKADGPINDVYEEEYVIYYGQNRFYLNNGSFYGFDLYNADFALNGVVCVGDSIDQIRLLGGIITTLGSDRMDEIRSVYWRPSQEGIYRWASVHFYYNRDNRITYIGAYIDDL